MVAKMGDEIRKAVETLGVLSGSKKAKALYELRLKARRDHKAEMDWVYDDGLEKGLEKGREETARNALAKGLPMELIHEITGLDMETIKSLHGTNLGCL
jgi:predicted transposase/invertase (TIGR01784 family)